MEAKKKIKLHVVFRPGFLVEWLVAETRSITIPNTIRWIKIFTIMISIMSFVSYKVTLDVPEYIIPVFTLSTVASITFAFLFNFLIPTSMFTKTYTLLEKANRIMNFYNGNNFIMDIIFDDDAVIEMFPSYKKNENVQRTSYKKIKYIYTYGDFVVVSKRFLSNRKYMLLFYKDQLNCSWEEFESFIREKNPKVKIRPAKLF